MATLATIDTSSAAYRQLQTDLTNVRAALGPVFSIYWDLGGVDRAALRAADPLLVDALDFAEQVFSEREGR